MALNAHFLIVKTAKEMANGLFEVYARDNATYRTLRARGEQAARPGGANPTPTMVQ